MFTTFIVYFTLLFVIPFAGSKLKYYINFNKYKIHPFYWVGVLCFTIIIGLRYDVGVDYLLYKDVYMNSMYKNADFIAGIGKYVTFDPAFSAIVYFFTRFRLHFCFLFIAIAFLQSFFLFKFCQQYKFTAGWLLFYFITSATFFDSLNGMRQMTAFFMFLNTLKFIQERKLAQYTISIIIISLFHVTVLLMLPFYFIANHTLIKKEKLGISLILLSFLFSNQINHIIWNVLFSSIEKIVGDYRMASYLTQSDDLMVSARSSSLGIAQLIYLSTDIFTIININKLRKFYKNSFNIDIFFNLFIIGSILYNISEGSITLNRINYYFVNFRFIMLGLITYMLTKSINVKNKNTINIIILLLILISLAWFINAILNGSKNSPYQFINI
jgi:hypothetical protein